MSSRRRRRLPRLRRRGATSPWTRRQSRCVRPWATSAHLTAVAPAFMHGDRTSRRASGPPALMVLVPGRLRSDFLSISSSVTEVAATAIRERRRRWGRLLISTAMLGAAASTRLSRIRCRRHEPCRATGHTGHEGCRALHRGARLPEVNDEAAAEPGAGLVPQRAGRASSTSRLVRRQSARVVHCLGRALSNGRYSLANQVATALRSLPPANATHGLQKRRH
jgi:hypothetical protein